MPFELRLFCLAFTCVCVLFMFVCVGVGAMFRFFDGSRVEQMQLDRWIAPETYYIR